MREINKLKDFTIKKAEIKEKPYTISDGGNLRVVIKPNGSKVFEIYYNSPNGKKRFTSVGAYPMVTLKEARSRRDDYLKMVRDGIDPIDFFRSKKQKVIIDNESKFDNVADDWLELRKKELSPRTYKKLESLFNNFIKPYFKNKPIKDITIKEVSKLIMAKAKQASETADRMTNYLNRVWIYARSRGFVEHNIISDIDKKSLIPKNIVIDRYFVEQKDGLRPQEHIL